MNLFASQGLSSITAAWRIPSWLAGGSVAAMLIGLHESLTINSHWAGLWTVGPTPLLEANLKMAVAIECEGIILEHVKHGILMGLSVLYRTVQAHL